MTFRPPATKPTRRRSRQVDSRRAVFLNAAFGVATVVAVALLGGVLFSNWYSDHGVAIGSVNGVAISKDAVRARADVKLARDERLLHNYDSMRNAGQMTTADYQNLTSSITSAEASSQLYSDALNELTENLTLQHYADTHGISVSDADVDTQIVKDGTLPEMRHVKVIGVDTPPTPPAAAPTADQLAASKATAQGYLDSIKSGAKKWDDVYTDSTVSGTVSGTGDLGLQTNDGLSLDPDLSDAIFALQNVNDITAVFEGQDGVFRFATVTQIVAPYVDSGWKDAIGQAASGDDYRNAARAEAIKAVVQKSIESQYVTGPVLSRHVEEIFISAGYGQPGDGPEAKIKMMIFAPGHSTSNAASVAQTDPAWAEAKARADADYAILQKDITQFGKLATDTTTNDDPYVAKIGGDLPWLPSSVFSGSASSQAGLGMTAVPSMIFASGLAPGLQAPVMEPSLGYVIVDFQGTRPSAAQRIADVQLALATGTPFETVAKEYTEAPNASSGGDRGWISHYVLSPELVDAIFQPPVGGMTRMVNVSGNGYTIFKVLAEETRTPDGLGQAILKQSAFKSWLADLTASTNIWTDQSGLTAIVPASPTP